MRDDVVQLSFEDMGSELRALLAYEPNGAFDVVVPQPIFDRIRRETPVIQWDVGVAFFKMEDIVAGCRNPAIVSSNPATGTGMGMGSRDPLIPLHVDGASTGPTASCSTRCSRHDGSPGWRRTSASWPTSSSTRL